MAFCKYCGSVLEENASFCTNCGRKINDDTEAAPDAQVFPEEPEKKRKSGAWIIIVIVAVIIVIAAILIYRRVRIDNYKTDLYNTFVAMGEGIGTAENICVLESNVWRNCIFEEEDSTTNQYTMVTDGVFHDDFNDALAEFYADPEIIEKQQEVYNNQLEVTGMMKDLKNPPSECEEAYDMMKEFYDIYLDFTNLALNSGGYTLQSFSDTIQGYQKDCINVLQKISVMLQ